MELPCFDWVYILYVFLLGNWGGNICFYSESDWKCITKLKTSERKSWDINETFQRRLFNCIFSFRCMSVAKCPEMFGNNNDGFPWLTARVAAVQVFRKQIVCQTGRKYWAKCCPQVLRKTQTELNHAVQLVPSQHFCRLSHLQRSWLHLLCSLLLCVNRPIAFVYYIIVTIPLWTVKIWTFLKSNTATHYSSSCLQLQTQHHAEVVMPDFTADMTWMASILMTLGCCKEFIHAP